MHLEVAVVAAANDLGLLHFRQLGRCAPNAYPTKPTASHTTHLEVAVVAAAHQLWQRLLHFRQLSGAQRRALRLICQRLAKRVEARDAVRPV